MALLETNTDRPLSRRERQAADLVVQGLSNKEIAARMDISAHTAKYYVDRLAWKLGAINRTHAAALWAVHKHEEFCGRRSVSLP
jgi:DNA-binding CsgD family transcriptional regulator